MWNKHGNNPSHAELAMEAARRVARARRQSQKEKMGRVVCHHLLKMLNTEPEAPRAKPTRIRPGLQRAVRLDKPVAGEDRQISLGF